MSNTINFSIDLGTTNSLIAKYQSGRVEVFKNPVGLKDTLPSVVAFRKERIIVGDKAREMVEKDPKNVFSLFKRKMGTAESFFVKNLNEERTPIQLSALVLKELKNFVQSGENLDSVVITIPASFDTIQSNATKKAGYEAGFQEVVLLQEPIAASLAFANKPENEDKLEGRWLVYDLGGGTFDVALVSFEDGEMRVTDHEGDNFLGGLDFDSLIIEKIIVPHLNRKGNFGDLMPQLLAADGRYNKLYYELRLKAEDAKIQLSNSESVEIEFNIEDKDGDEQEIFLEIYRAQFEDVIRDKIANTIDAIQSLLEKNNIKNTDIQQLILIGGSTYIPLVKRMISENLQIKVNQNIDPTNAVAVGAAFFAGSKSKNTSSTFAEKQSTQSSENASISLKSAYQKTTQDAEEYYTAIVTGAQESMTYRITRQDGGFDSGNKKLTERISEVLPLMKSQINLFTIKIYDAQGNICTVENDSIEIVQGKFSLYGQPLPNDICIEIDDFENNITKLELIFEKNAILPLKKTIVRTVSKTINRGSKDSVLINVLEGSRYASPSACLPLGIIEFKGETLPMNLLKGSDVEITLEISESRDLKISCVLLMTDQEASDIFSPSTRTVNVEKLKTEIVELLRNARLDLQSLERHEDYLMAGKVNKAINTLNEMLTTLRNMTANDVTDARYQIEEQKRKVAQLLDAASNDLRTESVKEDYFDQKRATESWLQGIENEVLKARFERTTKNERDYLATNNGNLIKSKTRELRQIAWEIQQTDPVYLAMLFHHFAEIDIYKDEQKADHFRKIGEQALTRQNYDELKVAIYGLHALLPDEERLGDPMTGTGVG